MSLLLSLLGFFAASLFLCLSFLLPEIESQITRLLGALFFGLSFFWTPLLIKFFILLLCCFFWPYLGERLSLSFYRQLHK